MVSYAVSKSINVIVFEQGETYINLLLKVSC